MLIYSLMIFTMNEPQSFRAIRLKSGKKKPEGGLAIKATDLKFPHTKNNLLNILASVVCQDEVCAMMQCEAVVSAGVPVNLCQSNLFLLPISSQSRMCRNGYRRGHHFAVDNTLPISIVLYLKLTSIMILKELYSTEKCAICLDTFLRI